VALSGNAGQPAAGWSPTRGTRPSTACGAIGTSRPNGAEIAYLSEGGVRRAPIPWTETFPDDLLRLIFTCCHPAALSVEAQVAR
jgi:hypothetical protein